jgi:hypothetical protein
MSPADLPTAQLAAAQRAVEDLLREVAASGRPIDRHVLSQLDELAGTCARLAFKNDLPLTENARNLIAWCDHLDDAEWKGLFVRALRTYPLRDPIHGDPRRP